MDDVLLAVTGNTSSVWLPGPGGFMFNPAHEATKNSSVVNINILDFFSSQYMLIPPVEPISIHTPASPFRMQMLKIHA